MSGKNNTWFIVVAMLIFLYAFARFSGIFSVYVIPTPSNEPNLKVGSYLFSSSLIKPKRGEFAIFNYQEESGETTPYIKRIVAIEADTVEVTNGDLYVNSMPENPSYELQFLFEIDESQFKKMEKSGMLSNENKVIRISGKGPMAYLTMKEADEISAKNDRMIRERINEAHPITEKNYGEKWNAHFFGPFVVPEGHVFVMGDSRDNSLDSRFIGCINNQDILGGKIGKY